MSSLRAGHRRLLFLPLNGFLEAELPRRAGAKELGEKQAEDEVVQQRLEVEEVGVARVGEEPQVPHDRLEEGEDREGLHRYI